MGTKLRKQTKTSNIVETTTDYTGSFVYVDNPLKYILTPEGRVMANPGGTFEYQYFLKVGAQRKSRLCGNHLGNTRVTFDQSGTVLQEDSYYPFGMAMGGFAYQSGTSYKNKYLYNGKELQDDFGLEWYDYGARFYNPVLGRFTTVDPLAVKYNFQSPYLYAYNNPIRYTDYLGMGGEDEVEKHRRKNAGKTYRHKSTTNTYTYNGENSHTVTETTNQTVIQYSEDGATRTVTTVKTTTSETFSYNEDGTMTTTSTTQAVNTTEVTQEVGAELYQDGYVVTFNQVGEAKTNTLGIDHGSENVDLSGGRYSSLNEHIGAVKAQLQSYGVGSNLFQGSDMISEKKSLIENVILVGTSIAATFSKNAVFQKTGVAGTGAATGLAIVKGYTLLHDYKGTTRQIKLKK